MTTVYERNAPRLREVLAFLAERVGPTNKNDLFLHVEQRFPPEGEVATSSKLQPRTK